MSTCFVGYGDMLSLIFSELSKKSKLFWKYFVQYNTTFDKSFCFFLTSKWLTARGDSLRMEN